MVLSRVKNRYTSYAAGDQQSMERVPDTARGMIFTGPFNGLKIQE